MTLVKINLTSLYYFIHPYTCFYPFYVLDCNEDVVRIVNCILLKIMPLIPVVVNKKKYNTKNKNYTLLYRMGHSI